MLITAEFGTANTGATVCFRILNADKSVFAARTATGVTELVAGSGVFGVQVTDSDLAGRTVVWDIDGTAKTASETFLDALTEVQVRTQVDNAVAAYDSPTNAEMSSAIAPLATAAALAVVDGIVDAILLDTDELQTDWHDGGRLDLLLDGADAPTADAIADQVRTELAPELAHLDANVSSRAAPGAAMTLADNAVSAAALSADAVTEIHSGLALEATLQSVKARTDLMNLANIVVEAPVNGTTITAYRWVTLETEEIVGLAVPAGWTTIYFTVKLNTEQDDEDALIQIETSNPSAGTDGLKYLNGAPVADRSTGSLVVDALAGTASVIIADEIMGELAERAGLVWDIKSLVTGDSSSKVLAKGYMNIRTAVTRAT